jgi:hypothetical protein
MKFKFGYVLIYCAFLAMALAALIGGCVIMYKNYDLKTNGIHTKALITGASENSSSVTRTSLHDYNRYKSHFFPELKYLVNGDSVHSATHSAADNVDIAIGDEVDVVYRPLEPEYVELKVLIKENIIVGGICTGLGILFTSIIGLFGVRIIKMKKAERAEELHKQHNFKL